jgi:glycerol 3-phosphatase-2
MRSRVRGAPADRFEVVLIDLDGTLYIWPDPVPGSPEAVATLRARGCRVGFLTNDPRHDRSGYAQRLEKIGVQAAPEEVLTTGVALAVLLRREGYAGANALVLGTPAFKAEVLAAGLVDAAAADPRSVDLVVVGGSADLGSRELTAATRALRVGARLFGSNRDPVFPTPSGPAPAAGPYLASVEVAGGVVAITAGKPELPIFEAARQQLGSGPGAMVGDRLDSDVAGGQQAGLAGVLVLSGGTSEEDLAVSPVVPDLVCADLAEFAGI